MLGWKRLIICVIIVAIVGTVIWIFLNNNMDKEEKNIIDEYTPEEEITDEQIRQTMLSLYFEGDNGIIPEARLIDVKKLIKNPYETILELLIAGPKNNNLQKTIPEETKINKIEKDGENLIIDFSREFIENHKGGETEEKNTIKSIVNTLTELTEINGIKIKIDGEENKEFKDGIIKFNIIFNRENI